MSVPLWADWTVQRGSNEPQGWRWRDAGGPVDLTGTVLALRITLWDGTAIDSRSDVDPGWTILDQARQDERGCWLYQLPVALTRSLPAEPPPIYEVETRLDGLHRVLVRGRLRVMGGGNTDG